MKPDELARVIGEYDALVIRSGSKVTADTLKSHGKLRVIGRAGIGVDNIDVAAATARGIVVMNTPGGNNVTTAEHAITLMLAVGALDPAGRRVAPRAASGSAPSSPAPRSATRRSASSASATSARSSPSAPRACACG